MVERTPQFLAGKTFAVEECQRMGNACCVLRFYAEDVFTSVIFPLAPSMRRMVWMIFARRFFRAFSSCRSVSMSALRSPSGSCAIAATIDGASSREGEPARGQHLKFSFGYAYSFSIHAMALALIGRSSRTYSPHVFCEIPVSLPRCAKFHVGSFDARVSAFRAW